MIFKLTDTPYPDGTTVYAYDATGYDHFPGANPPGDPVEEATASNYAVTFNEVEDGVSYVAAGEVGGEWRYIRFLPESDSPDALKAHEGASTEIHGITDTSLIGSTATKLDNLAIFNVKDYGAVGDGATDDTAAIQEAINAAAEVGGKVVGGPGDTYLLKGSGSTRKYPSTGETSYEYALALPSNVTLDLGSLDLKLAAGADVVAVTNADTENSNISIIGLGTIDGNSVDLSNKPLIWFEGVTGLSLDLRVVNTDYIGLYVIGCTEVESRWIEVDTAVGIAVYLGSPTHTTSGNFGTIVVRNTSADPENEVNFPGNPLYCNLVDSTIECVAVQDTSAGVKVDRASRDLQVGLVLGDNCSTGNSGFKLQGTEGEPGPTRVAAGLVKMTGQGGPGLYMERCVDCTVGVYTGKGNGTEEAFPDVWIGGTRDTVGTIRSDEASQNAVLFREYAADADLGIVKIRNPNQSKTASTSAVVAFNKATGHIGSLTATDTEENMFRAYSAGGAETVVTVGRLRSSGWTNVAFSLSTAKLAQRDVVQGAEAWEASITAANTAIAGRASAETLGLNNNSEAVDVTGEAEIKKITATYCGHIVVLKFTGTAKVIDGENLKIAGNFEASPDDTLTLLCNGTNWYEVARSAN